MKKVLLGLAAIVVAALVVILTFFKKDTKNPYTKTTWGKFGANCETENIPSETHGNEFAKCDYTVPNGEIPVFEDAAFEFENEFDAKKSLPIMASAMVDLDNDGVDEVFIAGGVTQEDAIFKYDNGNFIDITNTVNLPKKPENTSTYGAVSFDLDNDGRTDLLVNGDYGVLWYRNTESGFEVTEIEVPLNDKSVAASITLGDINHDGFIDMFVSAYIKLDKMEGQTIFKDVNYGGSSLLMLNNGDNTFKDVTEAYGLTYIHNTFMAVLVDVDNDAYLDLVVAHDTGEVRTYKNNEGKSFTKKTNPTTGKYAYPMGIAVGDYNNDGNIDFFFSNTGTSVPEILAKGDLEEGDEFVGTWLLFKNEGNFEFTDTAEETKVADFEFSWGAIFEDYNLDGLQDLVVSENYVDFPPHKLFKLPGRFLVQRPDGTFAAVEDQANAINMHYGITPLSSDFNQDGYPDMVFANIGSPILAKINKGGDANFIAIRFAENTKNVGAKVTITKTDGTIQSDVYVIGEGLVSDQTSTLTFGLAQQKEIVSILINYADGTTKTINNPKINTIHKL